MAVALMSSKNVEAYLQDAAKAAHGITIKEEPKKWTSYSNRIGTCILVIEGGDYGPFIKIFLHRK